MEKIKVFWLTIWLALVAPFVHAHSAPELLASYHFIGANNLSTNEQSAKLKQVWALPETKTFLDLVLKKIAAAPGQILEGRVQESEALVRPLLDDILASESMAELRHGATGPGEFLFAIRLDPKRVGIWQTNVAKLAGAWFDTKMGSQGGKSDWELKRKASPDLIRFSCAGDWVVIGVGENELPLQQNFSEIVRKKGGPHNLNTNWFEAEINYPALQKWLPALAKTPLQPARFQIEVSPRAGDLRTSIRAIYPQKLNHHAEEWQIPTNIIRDPLVSFTAAQNLGLILKTPRQLQQLGFNPLTNRFYFWAQSSLPFLSFAAMPVQNATNSLFAVSKRAPEAFNPLLSSRGGGRLVNTNNSLVWEGISLMRPELLAMKERAGEFLLLQFFPLSKSTNPPPPELLGQVLPRTNLVYYHWEWTQERLGQWQLMSKALPIFPTNGVAKISTNAPASTIRRNRFADETWLSSLAPLLGNTITEATVVGENEIRLTRKSAVGFTGFELLSLAHWMNDPRFPLFDWKESSARQSSRKK